MKYRSLGKCFHKLFCLWISILLILIIPLSSSYNAQALFFGDEITNYDIVQAGHEIGTHGTKHVDTNQFSYDEALSWASDSISDIESSTKYTSRWADNCLSISYPYSSTNLEVQKACYDAGLRIGGQNQHDSSYCAFCESYELPENDLDWLNINRTAGSARSGSADLSLLEAAEEAGTLADAVIHARDRFDKDFFNYLQNSKIVWRATWGEVRSYCGLAKNLSVLEVDSFESKGYRKYDLTLNGDADPYLWNVPVTLKFKFNNSFNGFDELESNPNSNDAVFIPSVIDGVDKEELVDISNDQSMREGFRLKGDMLYISVLAKTSEILVNERFDFEGVSKWWNGLNWTAVVHVDDVSPRNFYGLITEYNSHDFLQPLTLMVKGKIQWPLTDPLLVKIGYSVFALSIIIAIVVVIFLWRRRRKRRGKKD
ncbi:MAG: hypothetical protein JSV49_03175 [Thermoplasmata archaeon]|nr:MAG: hypothetical protein JSV49_03175 [Thermoplasmata archaeon]